MGKLARFFCLQFMWVSVSLPTSLETCWFLNDGEFLLRSLHKYRSESLNWRPICFTSAVSCVVVSAEANWVSAEGFQMAAVPQHGTRAQRYLNCVKQKNPIMKLAEPMAVFLFMLRGTREQLSPKFQDKSRGWCGAVNMTGVLKSGSGQKGELLMWIISPLDSRSSFLN